MMRCDLVPKLDEYLSGFETAEFEWGKNDCGLFVCGWAKVVTGRDPLVKLGTWSNELEAQNVIGVNGGSMAAAADIVFVPRNVITARIGDIVHFTQPDQTDGPLGICLGQFSAFLNETSGYRRIKTRHCDRAWSID